ncbi:MAG: MopE-related protein [Pseudomonadota bacterium]
MMHWIRMALLPLTLALALAAGSTGCMPELDPGTSDTTAPPDVVPGDNVGPGDISGACKDSTLPTCKTAGVCNALDASGLPRVWSCNEETLKWTCDYTVLGELYEKKETLCDGLDNDCDGDKDEVGDVAFAEACPAMNHGVCATAPGAVAIACVGTGNPPAYAFVCDATEVPDYTPKELFDPQVEDAGDLCDNMDNDCDGETDEDHEHDGGLTATELAGLSYSLCQGFGGICNASVTNEDPYQASGKVVFRCNQGGMECNYKHVTNFNAPESLCDGIDNDCDGDTDEVTDITKSSCPYQGVCDGKVSAFCLNGAWICDMTQALENPAYQIEETLCDGQDNDCDGDADEGLDWESVVAARCGGTCDTPFCATWNGDCPGAAPPTFDEDDRCPRVHRDDSMVGKPWVPDLDPYGKPVLPGVCQYDPITEVTDVLLHCLPYDGNEDGTPEAAFLVCRYDALEHEDHFVHTANESVFHDGGSWCDNLDNDCDGVVDAHKVTDTSVHQIQVSESNPLDLIWTPCKILGECGVGTTATCEAGAWTCSYGAGPVEVGDGEGCVPDADNPACQWVETLCDGKDNDCDGEVDEGITSTAGDALTAADCDQEGVCFDAIQAVCNEKGLAPGVWSCDYSDAFALGYAPQEDGIPDLCDGLDNDCDGVVDENISAGPLDVNYAAIIDEAGCLYQGICNDTVEATCNKEFAAPGVWECKYPDGFATNTVLVQGIVHEVECDGLDNDCDGVVDENLDLDFGGGMSPKFQSQCSFEGICADTMVWGCAQGDWTCTGDPQVGWEAEEATCDNVDNDCNGVVDEGLTDPGPAGGNCLGHGVGVCQVGLAANCSAGNWSCVYSGVQKYEAAEVSCDGVDNDCDGATDEALQWTTSPGVNACLSQGVCDPQDVVAICTGTPSGWLCNYGGIPTYKAVEQLGNCDGLDNDCDGNVDEQACGPCAPCGENSNCFNNLCRSDPFGGETFCATGATSCVMEDLNTAQCMSVPHGQTACITRTQRAICSSGVWNIDGVPDCSGNTPVCHAGLCKFCVPKELSCQGTQVYKCDDLGAAAYQISTCGAGQICVGAGNCITNGEFQVDVQAANGLSFDPKPRVAGLKGGGFVVVWGSASTTADGSGTAVMARLFGDDLQPAGAPFVVNELLEDNQSGPAVDAATVGYGRFVVAWETLSTAGDPGRGIALRIFEADGTPVSGELPVNQVTADNQSNPAVTMDDDGRFLVTWDTEIADIENAYDVKARYFLADGTPDGDEFRLNPLLANTQRTPDADFLPDGGLVTAWAALGVDNSGFAIVALTLDAAGVVDPSEQKINKYTFGSQKNPTVVALREGDKAGWFAVVWESTLQLSGDASGIFMQILDPLFTPFTPVSQDDIKVHQNDAGAQVVPRAARLVGDRLVVVWESADADSNGMGIARRIFNDSGVAVTNELPVNQSIAGDQVDPDVDGIDPTTFVVVWTNIQNGHIMGRILNN